MTRTPKPYPARAWIRYGDQSIEIDVEVVAWTERAVAIRWPGPEAASITPGHELEQSASAALLATSAYVDMLAICQRGPLPGSWPSTGAGRV